MGGADGRPRGDGAPQRHKGPCAERTLIPGQQPSHSLPDAFSGEANSACSPATKPTPRIRRSHTWAPMGTTTSTPSEEEATGTPTTTTTGGAAPSSWAAIAKRQQEQRQQQQQQQQQRADNDETSPTTATRRAQPLDTTDAPRDARTVVRRISNVANAEANSFTLDQTNGLQFVFSNPAAESVVEIKRPGGPPMASARFAAGERVRAEFSPEVVKELLVVASNAKLPAALEFEVSVKSVMPSTSEERSTTLTCERVVKALAEGRPTLAVNLKSRRVTLGSRTVELHDVFGLGSRAECVVCMTEPSDTTVLPCRHMALCSGCAATYARLPERDRTCPVCRGMAKSYLKVVEATGEDGGKGGSSR